MAVGDAAKAAAIAREENRCASRDVPRLRKRAVSKVSDRWRDKSPDCSTPTVAEYDAAARRDFRLTPRSALGMNFPGLGFDQGLLDEVFAMVRVYRTEQNEGD